MPGSAAQYVVVVVVVVVDYGPTYQERDEKKLRTLKAVKRTPVSREVVSLAALIILSFFSGLADSS